MPQLQQHVLVSQRLENNLLLINRGARRQANTTADENHMGLHSPWVYVMY